MRPFAPQLDASHRPSRAGPRAGTGRALQSGAAGGALDRSLPRAQARSTELPAREGTPRAGLKVESAPTEKAPRIVMHDRWKSPRPSAERRFGQSFQRRPVGLALSLAACSYAAAMGSLRVTASGPLSGASDDAVVTVVDLHADGRLHTHPCELAS